MTEYEKADAAFKAAYAIYDPIRKAYRDRKISDAEFLTARAAYDKAMADFDAAYRVAQESGE